MGGIKNINKNFNVVSLTDWHIPFESPEAINTAFKFCQQIKADIIIIHEAHDFYSLSRFDKDPNRVHSLQEEIDKVNIYFSKLRKTCPKSRIILLNSNHLARLQKYLWSQAPALSSLRSLEIENLLDLKNNNIEYKEDFVFRKFLFKHGSVVRQDSGYTCKAEFLKEGMSGASGHTHRLGQYFATKRGGSYTWLESGCLCKLNPEYVKGTANWQQGISLVSFKGTHFNARAIPIIDYEIIL